MLFKIMQPRTIILLIKLIIFQGVNTIQDYSTKVDDIAGLVIVIF